jgi:hypothetical protein
MEDLVGLKLTTFRFEAGRSIRLNYRSMKLALPVGFKPTTPEVEARCSIQLSYGSIGWHRV